MRYARRGPAGSRCSTAVSCATPVSFAVRYHCDEGQRGKFVNVTVVIPMVKDGAIQWGTSARLIQCVFNMSNLSESENRALRYLWLLMGIRMSRKEYKAWSRDASLNTINSLIRSNWVQLAVVLEFSSSISVKHRQMRTFRKGIFPYAFILGLISFLMAKEPHLSGLILIVAVGVILLFAGGIHPAWIIAGMAAVSFAAYLLLSGAIPYGQSRIAMWEDPFADAAGDGYQLSQSLIAIGSGGLWGLGLGKSRQKFLFLPEVQNDFIFSIVAEELGLVGATLILLIFSLLIIRGYHVALRAKDRFGALLCVGITSLLAMQTFLNVAVVTGLLPTTGISLPFFSYGGTALVTQLMEMGIILSVSRQATG